MKRSTNEKTLSIAGRLIGPNQAPYIVAEMSGNHNGDIERALRIVEAAKKAGADAVKLQTYRADTITIDHDSADFVVSEGLWAGRNLFELYEEAHTPWEWHERIFSRAREIGLQIFSSPFDHSSVDFLESLDAPAYKIASPELIDIPLIKRVAETGKPIIMSTGMATVEEIDEAVEAARSAGANELAILHCTAAYPAPADEANLATIRNIAERYNAIAGLSDHTMGTTVAVLAVGLGASLIEKHFTLSRAEGGVDSAFSLEPDELAELVSASRIARASVGEPTIGPTPAESTVLKNRRSLYVVKGISKGEPLSKDNIRSIRPGAGIKPRYFDAVLGKPASRKLKFGDPLDFGQIENGEAIRAQFDRDQRNHVLVTSASAKAPLIRAVQDAARTISPRMKVFAGDTNPQAVTRYVADEFWQMPPISEDGAQGIVSGCKERGITKVIPTRDGELLFWARHQKYFAEHGITVIVSPYESIQRCLDKFEFATFGIKHELPFIRTYEHPGEDTVGPYVVKERQGAGAQSVGLNLDKDDAIAHGTQLEQPIYQPFIEGFEISVDAWVDQHHQVKGLVLRKREYVVNGESQITTTFRESDIEALAEKTLEALKLRGPVVLQLLIDKLGAPHIIECNTRFGGASTTSIAAGLDSIMWSLQESQGVDVSELPFRRIASDVRQVRLPQDFYDFDL